MPVTPGTIAVTEGSGKTLDCAQVTVSATTVQREIVAIASPSTAGNYAEVNSSSQLSVSVDNNPVLGAGSAVIGHVITDSGTITTITNSVTVVGAAASGAAKSGNPVQGGAVFNTTQPTVTTGQVVENQATARGAQIVATGVDTFNVTVNAALASGTNVIGHVITDTGSTTAVTGTVTVVGDSASGATKAGNPVQIGGVFNTTQPTVTTGQTVEAQSTARGAQIVATGADTFNVTVNAALPAGSAVIGHVIADTGSTTAVTGNVTVVQATGTNLHAVLDSGSTTAVTQATGTNLHMVVDSGTITTLSTLTTITNAVTVVGAAASGATKSGNPLQIGGVFNTTQPTVTTGQAVEAQSTARGAQIVATGVDTFTVTANQGGAPWSQNLTQVAGATLGAPSAYGTSPGAVTVPGVNAFVTNSVSVSGSVGISAANSTDRISTGTITSTQAISVGIASASSVVIQVTGTWTGTLVLEYSADGSVFNPLAMYPIPSGTSVTSTTANGVWVAPVGGLNTVRIRGNTVASGTATINMESSMGGLSYQVTQVTAANLNATVVGTGTFAVQAVLGAETTKVIGTTRITGNVGGVMDAAGQNAASPASELLVAGQFNTTPTTITSGNVSPLQLDSAGNLLVNVKTGGTSGTVAQGSTTSGQSGMLIQGAVTTSAPTYTTAQTSPLSLDTSGNLRVAGTFAAGALPDATTTISLTAAAQTAQILCAGRNSFGFILTSVGTGGQVIAEGSIDGTNWFSIDVWSEALETWISGGAAITTTGQWWFEPLGSLNAVRVRCSAITSGTITGNLIASAAVMGTFEYQTSPGQAVAPNIVSIGGSVTTSAPSYTTGTANSLSLDTAGNLRVAGNALADLVGGAGTLSALNAAATINAAGYLSVGGFLAAGTLIGTIVPEVSFDGGTTWTSTYFDIGNKVSSIVFSSSNTATSFSIIASAGASNMRVRVSAFTSGTATCTLRANEIHDPTLIFTGNLAAAVQPPTVAQVGGWVTTAAPTYTTATLNALSLTTTGALRVGVTGNTGATVDAAITSGVAPTNVVWVSHAPATVSAASLTPKFINVTAATNIKAAAGSLYGLQLINLATTTATTTSLVQYIHFFDTSNATLSTANWKFALPLPGNPVNVIGTGAGPALSIPPGAFALANFANGISIVVNTTSTSNTTAAGTAPAGTIWIL